MSMDTNDDRASSEAVYLELSDGQSHKFYEVLVNGAELSIRYGRIGTSGQLSSTVYATVEQAQAEATRKINEKLRKGYVQIASGEDSPVLDQPMTELDPSLTSATTDTALQAPQAEPALPVTDQTSVMQAETTDIPPFLSHLPPQFESLRSLLEANLMPYIKLTATDVGHLNSAGYSPCDWSGDPLKLWQSKIGGHPYLPKDMSYPSDRETGDMMMFLMQVNCADLPIVEGLSLPRQGLLQFYVGLNVPMCELSPEQHHIRYFPEISQDKDGLITDFSFLAESAAALEWYDSVYALNFSMQRDVFWDARQQLDESFEIATALTDLGEDFDEWISDYEDECSLEHGRNNKVGGYPELHSEVAETIEGFRGRLLLELQDPSGLDDNFYFFIEDSELANLNFSNVQFYFLRT